MGYKLSGSIEITGSLSTTGIVSASEVTTGTITVTNIIGAGVVSSSNQIAGLGNGILSSSVFNSPSQGVVTAIINGITTNVNTGLEDTNSPQFANVKSTGFLSASGNLVVEQSASIAGDLTVGGIVTATEIHTTVVSSSITSLSGSNTFGQNQANIHNFTGSLIVSRSLKAVGILDVVGNMGVTGTASFGSHITASGNISASGTSTSSFGRANAISFHGDGSALTNLSPTSIPPGTYSSSLQILTNITASGNISASGNLDLTGNANIDGKITIANGAKIKGELSAGGTGTIAQINVGDRLFLGNSALGTTLDSGTSHLLLHSAGEVYLDSDTGIVELKSNGNPAKVTFNTIAGHITSSGNISSSETVIGLTGSFKRMDVAGGFKMWENTSLSIIEAVNNEFVLQTKRDIDDFYVKLGASSTTRMFISSSGNIGIGTQTPGEKLEVVGNISASGFINTLSHITSSGNISASGIVYASGLTVVVSGSASPDAVFKTTSDHDLNVAFEAGVTTPQKFQIKVRDQSSNFDIASDIGGVVTNIMSLSGSGNVGIGTSSPDEKLTVAGNIWASGSNGHITASGNISSSGNLITTHVTASGNISASGTFAGDGSGLTNIPATGIVGLNLSQIVTGSFNASISPQGGLNVNTDITASGNISATGNISASGTLTAGSLTSHGNLTFGNGNDRTITGPENEDLILNARPNGANEGLKIQINGTDVVSILKDIGTTINSNITASGNISGSSTSTLTIGGDLTSFSTGSFPYGIIPTIIGSKIKLNSTSQISGSVIVIANDNNAILSTHNSSAGSAQQFVMKHNLGSVELLNKRGKLILSASGHIKIKDTILLVTSSGINLAEFKSSTNKSVIQLSDNDTDAYMVVEDDLFGIGGDVSSPHPFSIDLNNERVGIGTSTPLNRLHIEGTTTANTTIKLEGTDTAALPHILLRTKRLTTGIGQHTISSANSGGPTGGEILSIDGDEMIQLKSNNTTALTVRGSTGDIGVGIGLTTPKTNLHLSSGSTQNVYLIGVNQHNNATAVWHPLGNVDHNNGHLSIKGILSGHTHAQGNATIDIKISAREGLTVLGSVEGSVGTGADILLYDDSSASEIRAYLKTTSYGLVNLDLKTTHGADISYNRSAISTTDPSGVYGANIFTLSTDTGSLTRTSDKGGLSIAGAGIPTDGGLKLIYTKPGSTDRRLFAVSSSTGTLLKRLTAGGWSMKYGFEGLDGTHLGGFGAHGNDSTLTRFYIGTQYDSRFLEINQYGNMGIGAGTIAGDTRVHIVTPGTQTYLTLTGSNAGNSHIGYQGNDNYFSFNKQEGQTIFRAFDHTTNTYTNVLLISASINAPNVGASVKIPYQLQVGETNNKPASSSIKIKSATDRAEEVQFYHGATRVGEIGSMGTTWLRINQHTSKNIYTPRYIRADGGFFVDDTSTGIDGSGNFIGGGTVAGGAATFTTVNTGQGANELYDMDQNVKKSNSVQFVNISSSGDFISKAGANIGKFRFYGAGSNYAIGMTSDQNFGGIGDWAMVFTFDGNVDTDRGFVWRDSDHSTSQGAMSLTTQGNLNVASGIKVGYGISDTAGITQNILNKPALDILGMKGIRKYPHHNQAFYRSNGSNTKNSWRRFAAVSFSGTGTYDGLNMKVNIVRSLSNYGVSAACEEMDYYVSCRHSGGTNNDLRDKRISGPAIGNDGFVRVVQGTGAGGQSLDKYEIQIRQITSYRTDLYTLSILGESNAEVNFDSSWDGTSTGWCGALNVNEIVANTSTAIVRDNHASSENSVSTNKFDRVRIGNSLSVGESSNTLGTTASISIGDADTGIQMVAAGELEMVSQGVSVAKMGSNWFGVKDSQRLVAFSTASGIYAAMKYASGVAQTNQGSHHNHSALAFYAQSTLKGWISLTAGGTGGVDQITFTGQHKNVPGSGITEDYKDKVGQIVISTGEYYNLNGGYEKDKPTINEALPKVILSSQVNDKRVWGVISDTEDDNDGVRADGHGVFYSSFEREDNRMWINSVGEGGIWISNYNGNLENGDYITTCPIEGIGMKQDDDLLHNYTVAKITQDCNFTSDTTDVTYDGQTYKMQFVGCTYHCG